MSTMEGKKPTPTARNTLPRSESSLDDETFDGAGFKELRELNTVLEKYIKEVRGCDFQVGSTGSTTSISVNINRSEIESIQSEYDGQLAEWKKKYDDKDLEIAKLKAEIERLKAEIKRLNESNNIKDGTIQERDLTIEALKSEINRLNALMTMLKNQKEIYELQIKRLEGEVAKLKVELASILKAFVDEQQRNQELCGKITSKEKELRFKIEVLGKELASERGKTNIDIASLDTKIENQYSGRLDIELDLLRQIYDEHMKVSKETLEKSYEKKVSDLKTSLNSQPDLGIVSEEITKIRIDLEQYKKKIEELGSNNQILLTQKSRLWEEMREKELMYAARMKAKDTEMENLEKNMENWKIELEKLRKKLNAEASEVKVYNQLITPEVNRMASRYSEHFFSENLNGSFTAAAATATVTVSQESVSQKISK